MCSVDLHGDSTFSVTQSKIMIPREQMRDGTARDLFLFLARQIEAFLRIHHADHFATHVRQQNQNNARYVLDLGFTFSFPVRQLGVNNGTLIRWTKGFDLPDAVGKDVCALLQSAIDELNLPVRVSALVNDTVGTLMARSYASNGKKGSMIGAIFGTGTNGAYVESLEKISKLESMYGAVWDKSSKNMIVNTEWGSFDNSLKVLPNTIYDQQLNAGSVNPGYQMFEKRVSGMFLGEILRLVLLSMHTDPSINLFKTNTEVAVPEDSALYRKWGLDTSSLSAIGADTSPDLQQVKKTLNVHLKIDYSSDTDCRAVKLVADAIAKRAARLSAVPLAGILVSTGALDNEEGPVDIGVDGSLIEYYPNYQDLMREALREVPGVGHEGEKKISIGVSKDGSGVGAALIALVASSNKK